MVYLKENEVVVQRGDTISSLAARHHVSVKALVECNGLTPPYGLKNVQKLRLPPGSWTVPEDSRGTDPVLLKEREDVQWTTVEEESSLEGERPILLADADTNAELDSQLEETLVQNPKPSKSVDKKPVHAGWGVREKNTEISASTKKPQTKVKKVRFLRPVSGAVTKKFQRNKQGAPSTGVRMRASKGTPIYATADGTVVISGKMKGEPGKAVVLIKHSDGWSSFYKMLSSASVSKNESVKQGDVLGVSEGPEIIFELRDKRSPVDPEKHMK